MVAPADTQNVIVLEMFVAGVMQIQNGCFTDLNVGHFGVHQVVRSDDLVDGLNFRLVGGHQYLLERAENDNLHCSLEGVHLNIIKHAVALLEKPVFLEFDPEVMLDSKEVNVAFNVRQNKLILRAEQHFNYFRVSRQLFLYLAHGCKIPHCYQAVLLPAYQVSPFSRDADSCYGSVLAVVGCSQDCFSLIADLKENNVAERGPYCQILDAVGGDDSRNAHSSGSLVKSCGDVVQHDESNISDLRERRQCHVLDSCTSINFQVFSFLILFD